MFEMGRTGVAIATCALLAGVASGACGDADPPAGGRVTPPGAPPPPPPGGTDASAATDTGAATDAPSGAGQDAAADTAGLPAYDVITKFGHPVIRTVTVHKNGGEDRTVYVEASKVAQAPTSGVLPDGTRLLMQVNAGSCFVIEKVAGTWQYGTFSPTASPAVFTTGPNASCSGCHTGAAEPGVFTAGSLRRLAATHVGEEINCPAGPGPTPCAASVYR